MHQLSTLFADLPGGGALWSFLAFVIVVGVLVFVHELGHYLAARSVGIRVEVFSIGFGREVFGWFDRAGTRWKVCLMPLGGYVKMFAMSGEVQPKDVKKADREHAFIMKNVWQRMWVVAAGPLANFVFAIVVVSGVFMFVGEARQLAVIGGIQEDMPAKAAGFELADKIVAVDGKALSYWTDFANTIRASKGKALAMTVERNGAPLTLTVTPKVGEVTDILGKKHEYFMVGLSPKEDAIVFEKHGLLQALWGGVDYTYDKASTILIAIWRMATGQMPPDLGGPFTIAKVAGDFASAGGLQLLMFMVFISINLGLVNLFPVPVLDGGHLLYFAIEAVKGSPVSERGQEWANRAGLGIIFLLMAFVLYKDVRNVILPYFIG